MFRRSGSLCVFYVAGSIPDPRQPAFATALANRRFRTIEAAAADDASIGWVSPGDPTGASFDLEDMDLDRAIWLRFRMDRKKLPPIWLRIHYAEAERSAGRKLKPAERRELKDDLTRQLLPRILPAVQLVDALYDPDAQTMLLFGTSTAMRDGFRKLFFETFAVELIEADAHGLALRVGLDRDRLSYLDEASPVEWERRDAMTGSARPRRAEELLA